MILTRPLKQVSGAPVSLSRFNYITRSSWTLDKKNTDEDKAILVFVDKSKKGTTGSGLTEHMSVNFKSSVESSRNKSLQRYGLSEKLLKDGPLDPHKYGPSVRMYMRRPDFLEFQQVDGQMFNGGVRILIIEKQKNLQ